MYYKTVIGLITKIWVWSRVCWCGGEGLSGVLYSVYIQEIKLFYRCRNWLLK